MVFRNNGVCLWLLLVCVWYARVESSREGKKRLVMEQDYDTMLLRLDNLTQKFEAFERAESMTHQPVSFMAYLSKTIPGQNHQIIFDVVKMNLGNGYHATHGNFIAPISGLYQFAITACSTAGHFIVLELTVNGAVVDKVIAGDDMYGDCNTGVFLQTVTAGDDVYVQHETQGDYLLSYEPYGRPSFSGVLLNAM